MANSRLEELLEGIVVQNAEMIDKLSDIASAVGEINEELNWIGEHSFAKRVVNQLDQVELAIRELQP